MNYVLITVMSYLLGSIPFGLIFGRVIGGVDIRNYGSKRMGATNVTRTIGRKYGFVVFVLDALKGIVAILLTRWLFQSDYWALSLAAISAILGHIFPIFANFKGGRGVATALGGVLALFPWGFLVAFFVWWGIVWATRYVSLASMLGAVSTAITAGIFLMLGRGHVAILLYCVAISIIIIASHHDNIARLRAGTESKFGQKVKI